MHRGRGLVGRGRGSVIAAGAFRTTFAAHILVVLNRSRKAKCSQSKRPQALQQVINAHGPVPGVQPGPYLS